MLFLNTQVLLLNTLAKTLVLFQSPLPLQKTEQVMIYDTIKTKPATVTSAAGYCTDKPKTLDPKMWANFKHFQASILYYIVVN